MDITRLSLMINTPIFKRKHREVWSGKIFLLYSMVPVETTPPRSPTKSERYNLIRIIPTFYTYDNNICSDKKNIEMTPYHDLHRVRGLRTWHLKPLSAIFQEASFIDGGNQSKLFTNLSHNVESNTHRLGSIRIHNVSVIHIGLSFMVYMSQGEPENFKPFFHEKEPS